MTAVEGARDARRAVADEWPLVGRDAVLEHVCARVAAGLRGRGAPSGVLLVGDAGTGKTRLATEVRRRLTTVGGAEGAPVHARLVATRSSASIPLGALAPLLPRDLPVAPSEGEVRADALRRAADDVLGEVEGRLLLLVDDVQHLDDASATVLLHLALSRRVVLVATLRAGEPVADPVTALWKDGVVDRVDLAPLDRPAVADLLEAVLGDPVEGTTVHGLHTSSGGNPLFLREIVLGAADSGALRRVEGVWRLRDAPTATPRLVELIAARLEGLDPRERQVLEVLAVGEPLGPDLLAPEAHEGVLEPLEDRGLLTVAVDGQRCLVRFAHPLYGDVVRAQLTVLRTRQINRSLADAIEARGARRHDDVLRVALWRLDGGGTIDPALMLAAARTALFTFEFELGERLARAAFEADADAEAGLLLGELLMKRGQAEEGDAVLARVEAAASDPTTRALAAGSRASNLFWGLGRDDDAVEVLTTAESIAGPGPLRDELVAVRANITMLAGHPTRAIALAGPLLDATSPRVVVNASIAAACAHATAGRRTEAVAIAERARAVHVELGDEALLAKPWIHDVALALASTESGPLAEADRLAAEGYEGSLERREPAAQAWFALVRARAALLRGRPATADRFFRESAALFGDIHETGPRRWGLAGVVITAALRGDTDATDEAMSLLDRTESPMGMMETEVARARAWWRAAHGDLAGARAVLEAAVADAAERGCHALAGPCGWDLVRMGDARAGASTLAPHADAPGSLGLRAATTAAVARRDAEALERLADDLFSEGFELEAAEAAAVASECVAREGAGRRAAALAHLSRVRRAACEGAFTRLLATGAGADPLTERQRDVALLAAGGMPSKAIAEQLAISRRTVDNNLQQAFAKLGVRRRTDLAAALGVEPGRDAPPMTRR